MFNTGDTCNILLMWLIISRKNSSHEKAHRNHDDDENDDDREEEGERGKGGREGRRGGYYWAFAPFQALFQMSYGYGHVSHSQQPYEL